MAASWSGTTLQDNCRRPIASHASFAAHKKSASQVMQSHVHVQVLQITANCVGAQFMNMFMTHA